MFDQNSNPDEKIGTAQALAEAQQPQWNSQSKVSSWQRDLPEARP